MKLIFNLENIILSLNLANKKQLWGPHFTVYSTVGNNSKYETLSLNLENLCFTL